MDFIQFIKESPHFNMPDLQIECPHKHHTGGLIDGSKEEWQFDYYGEHFKKFTDIKDANMKAFTMEQIIKFGKRGPTVPVYCRVDEIVFMWNSSTGKTYAPVSEEEIRFCDIVAKAILVTDGPSHTNEQLGITDAKVLRTEDSIR